MFFVPASLILSLIILNHENIIYALRQTLNFDKKAFFM